MPQLARISLFTVGRVASEIKHSPVPLKSKSISNNQSLTKKDFFTDEDSEKESITNEIKKESTQEADEEIDLDELDLFDENGVFRCNCGKSYLASQKWYILKHIKKCLEFKKRMR